MAIDVTAQPIEEPELDEDSTCDACNYSLTNGDDCYCTKCWDERGDRIDELEAKVDELEEKLESNELQEKVVDLETKLKRIRLAVKLSCEQVLSLDRKLFQIDGVPIWDEEWNLNI